MWCATRNVPLHYRAGITDAKTKILLLGMDGGIQGGHPSEHIKVPIICRLLDTLLILLFLFPLPFLFTPLSLFSSFTLSLALGFVGSTSLAGLLGLV